MTSGSTMPAVAVRGVCKSYGDHRALDEVDLTVAEGTIFSLLGPNGAGKTTMVRILSTLIPADAGEIEVAGQFSAVDNLLTGAENLRLMADLRHLGRDRGRRRVRALLERFDLADA